MTEQTEEVRAPYESEQTDPRQWSDGRPFALSVACYWNRFLPRGKGWFPRVIGRTFPESFRHRYIVTKHGARLAIEPTSLDVYTHMLNNGLTWNEHALDACAAFLDDGGVFYDIGANVGLISLEMSQLFADRVQVISFEPQPALAHAIALSAQLNAFEHLSVFDVMLGAQPGTAQLFIGSHSIHASAIAREKNSVEVTRQICTLDQLVESKAIPPPNVIKIDIEGGELNAFRGACNTIARYRPYIIFESDDNMERFGYTRRDLFRALTDSADYEFFVIRGTKGDFAPLNDENMAQHADILARPK